MIKRTCNHAYKQYVDCPWCRVEKLEALLAEMKKMIKEVMKNDEAGQGKD